MAAEEEKKKLKEEILSPILISKRIKKSIEEGKSFKSECSEIGKYIDRLSSSLRFVLLRLTSDNSSIYDRPVREIISDLTRNLNRTLTLVRKCKKSKLIVFVTMKMINSNTDFSKIFNLLESSIGDLNWLNKIFDSPSSSDPIGLSLFSLPPIARVNPILAWVWTNLAAIQMGNLSYSIHCANELASLALDNDYNKNVIIKEEGIPPLLKLLKDGSSPDSQISATNVLFNLATNQERVRKIVSDLGVPVIVQVLSDSSSINVQISIVSLISRMAENDSYAQEEFDREKAIRPLISYLSFDIILNEKSTKSQPINKSLSLNSSIRKEMGNNGKSNIKTVKTSYYLKHSSSSSSLNSEGSFRCCWSFKKEKENEDSELINKLKIKCAEALWMLSKGNASISKKITETKGLLCLAKILERETGELQFNCLMTVMEIASSAESNSDLRRSAFKTNSPAARAIVEQLLRIVQQEENPSLQIIAIKAIGSLARTFPARETRVIGPIVAQISNDNLEVATEATITLVKFASPENFICIDHSKAIIEYNGLSALMGLLREDERAQFYGLTLLCYLALNVGNEDELGRVRSTLEGAICLPIAQHPSLKELIPKTISSLQIAT